MKAVIQRVSEASVKVNGELTGSIKSGLAVLLGVIKGDTKGHAKFLAKKLTELRIFKDADDKMNLSVIDISGDILVVSQFTLGADCSHGRRPSFINAERPEAANELYEYFVSEIEQITSKKVATGVFGADMEFSLVNDGPVTIIFDTDEMGYKG